MKMPTTSMMTCVLVLAKRSNEVLASAPTITELLTWEPAAGQLTDATVGRASPCLNAVKKAGPFVVPVTVMFRYQARTPAGSVLPLAPPQKPGAPAPPGVYVRVSPFAKIGPPYSHV